MRFYEILKEYTEHLNLRKSLFEIDFNSKSVIQTALTAPISCGFEAETIWRNLSVDNNSDRSTLSWSEVEDDLSNLDTEIVNDRYSDWISEIKTEEFLQTAIDEFIDGAQGDRYYLRDFITSNDLQSEYYEFVYELKDEQDDVQAESPDVMADFILSRYDEDYNQYLSQTAYELDHVWNDAREMAENNYSIDDWIDDQYDSVMDMLDDLNIRFDQIKTSSKLHTVSSIIKNAFGQDAKAGDYHSAGRDTSPDYWRVETDPSIMEEEVDDVGIEIISPVYDTPAEMLSSIRRLFELFEQYDVYTNRSTGFHVTMSIRGTTENSNPNELKMALLLGDRYLLQQFDRARNSYTASQMTDIENKAQELIRNEADLTSLGNIEKALHYGVGRGKYHSIHFKPDTNPDGNRLVEFRIAGNDYLENTNRLEKAIVKYSTVLLAGYDHNAYREDYAKAILKLVNRMKTPTAVKGIPNTPFVNAVQTIINRFSYEFNPKEQQAIKELLNDIYQVSENQNSNVDKAKVLSFFEVLLILVTKLVGVKSKLPSGVVIGIRKGFADLNIDYSDFLKFLAKKEVSLPYTLNELLQSFRTLVGSSKLEVRPEDMPPTFKVKEHYQYLAPWKVVQKIRKADDFVPELTTEDLNTIIKVPNNEIRMVMGALDLLPNAIRTLDDELQDQIFEYYDKLNKKYNIAFYDESFPKFKKIQDVLRNANDNQIYEMFPIVLLSNHGIRLEPENQKSA